MATDVQEGASESVKHEGGRRGKQNTHRGCEVRHDGPKHAGLIGPSWSSAQPRPRLIHAGGP